MPKRPTWEETWMEVVSVLEKRSTCVYYKVAAVIAKGKHLISLGYNGAVSGEPHCEDEDVGCAKVVNGERLPPGSDKCRGAHAEDNAITRAGQSAEGCVIYISYRPCLACAKRIINAGIKKVIYRKDYDGEEEAISILHRNNVELIRFDSVSQMKFD